METPLVSGAAAVALTTQGLLYERFAFAAGETKEELWVMENFLPRRKDESGPSR